MNIQEMLLAITPQVNAGKPYCNAIDEDHYDSSQWKNRMPSNGYTFHEDNDGSVSVTYTSYFACFDGWDSFEDDCGDFPSMAKAVRAIYNEVHADKMVEKIRENIHKLSIKDATTLPILVLLLNELKFTGTLGKI